MMDGHRIRSFVRRAGRITAAQRRALDELWPEYGIEYSADTLDLARCFGNSNPVVLEIGFGDGDLLVQMAADDPASNFIGVEVHEPGIGRCLLGLQARELENVRLIRHDATDVLADQIEDGALERINLFFPDPWPKKRHHKRRIVRPDFLRLAAAKLRPGGQLHIATDWANYAEHIQDVAEKEQSFALADVTRGHRPTTKFETRGERLGHDIFDLRYVRK
jgi:tRNA (guanine-N7-)-methyltransferase